MLVSHQFYLPAGKAAEDVERMDSEIRTVGNIDEVSADVLERFDYAALGHIHKPMTSKEKSVIVTVEHLLPAPSVKQDRKRHYYGGTGRKGKLSTG